MVERGGLWPTTHPPFSKRVLGYGASGGGRLVLVLMKGLPCSLFLFLTPPLPTPYLHGGPPFYLRFCCFLSLPRDSAIRLLRGGLPYV